MKKSTIATLVAGMLVTHYLAFQAGQTLQFYKRPQTAASASPLPQPFARKDGVDQVLRSSMSRVDFGQIEGEQPRNQLITLANPGKDAVQISRVRSSCGCVSTVVEPMLVPAGGQAQMVVVLDPKLAAADTAVSLSVEYQGKAEVDRLMVVARKPTKAL